MVIDCNSSCLVHCIPVGCQPGLQPDDTDVSVNKSRSGDFKRRNWFTDVPGQCLI